MSRSLKGFCASPWLKDADGKSAPGEFMSHIQVAQTIKSLP